MNQWTMSPALRELLHVFAWVSALALLAALVLGVLLWRRLKRISITGGGYWQTLREVPLALVVMIDLLDLALESFSAPIIWLVLRQLGLQSLRDVATIEAIIPFTGPLPTMTLSWFAARLRDRSGRPLLGAGVAPAAAGGTLIEGERVAPGRWKAGP
jgi:hypothetical protein